jgi:hypothetical protein
MSGSVTTYRVFYSDRTMELVAAVDALDAIRKLAPNGKKIVGAAPESLRPSFTWPGE